MKIKTLIITIIALGLAVVYLVPVIWMGLSSFMDEKDILASRWIPSRVHLENYKIVLHRAKISRWFTNSLITASLGTLGVLGVGIFAGYSLGRMRYPGRRILFFFALSGFMIPIQGIMIPLYLMLKRFGLVNNLLGLILPAWPSSLAVFVLSQFMREIPIEFEEAARMDGASELQILFKVILPMSLPAIITVTVFHFTAIWNDFLWPLIIMTSDDMYTLPVGLVTLAGSDVNIRYGPIMAANVIASLPIIIVYAFFQRYLARGFIMEVK